MKALFTADIHMSNSLPFSTMGIGGCTDRLLEQVKVIDTIYKIAKDKKVDAIFILGDLFDHSRVDAVTLTHTIDIMVRTPAPLYILPGNHDATTTSGGRFTVEAFTAMKKKNIEVIGVEQNYPLMENKWGNIHFWPVSFRTKTETESAIKKIKKRMNEIHLNWMNVLLLHCSINGADSYGWTCDDGIDTKLFKGFKHVLAGHFHTTQHLISKKPEKCFYVGSPMQHHFGDENKPCGVWIGDFDKKQKFEFVEIDVPKFHTFDFDDFDFKNVKKSGIKERDFVRFNIEVTHADWVSKKVAVEEKCRILSEKGYRVDYRHKPITQNSERILLSNDGGEISLSRAISQYVKASETELKKKELKTFGKEILSSIEV